GSAIRFRVHSPRATRIEVVLFANPRGASELLRVPMALEAPSGTDVWAAVADASALAKAGLGDASATVYYGYRAWGPNWTVDPSFKPGSSAGFVSDVDAAGNRFNPNKVLFDPFALELSHDPEEPGMTDDGVYSTGAAHRTIDSAPFVPKGIVLRDAAIAGAI